MVPGNIAVSCSFHLTTSEESGGSRLETTDQTFSRQFFAPPSVPDAVIAFGSVQETSGVARLVMARTASHQKQSNTYRFGLWQTRICNHCYCGIRMLVCSACGRNISEMAGCNLLGSTSSESCIWANLSRLNPPTSGGRPCRPRVEECNECKAVEPKSEGIWREVNKNSRIRFGRTSLAEQAEA